MGENQEPQGRDRLVAGVMDWAETIVTAFVVVAILFTFVVRIITVDGGSMNPTYYDEDKVLVSSYGGAVERGDVVIIVNTLSRPIIKRVIATEGQTVDFDPELREVTVDGTPLFGEVFGIENGITVVPDTPTALEFPQTVPEGCVFVLGDNRGNSTDSRFVEVGMVDTRNILGKVIFNVYPLSKFGAAR